MILIITTIIAAIIAKKIEFLRRIALKLWIIMNYEL